MNFSYLFGPEQILVDLKVQDKWELIDRMLNAVSCSHAYEEVPEDIRDQFRDVLISREEESTTALGQGIGYPHARIPHLNRVFVAFAILAEPIDYGAPDNQPVNFAFMALLPEEKPTLGLKIMSMCSTLMTTPDIRDFLFTEKDPEKIHEFLENKELKIDTPIVAGDLMRAPTVRISPETPLRRVTRTMQKENMEAEAVLDENGSVLGEISCNNLFSREIPDYMKRLTTVPSIKNFNPFQEYFTADAKLVARDVMTTDVAVVNEDASLLEIVFLLSVQMYPKVYVCRDKCLLGTIDRITVLDRLLNL